MARYLFGCPERIQPMRARKTAVGPHGRGSVTGWRRGLVPRLFCLADLDAESCAKIHGQADVTDGSDVLVAGQVFCLCIDAEPGRPLIAAAEVKLGIAVIEIAIGQQQGVEIVGIGVLKIGGVVAAAGKCRGKEGGKPAAGVAGREEAGMRRAAERTRSPQRRNGADRYAAEGWRLSAG